MWVSYFPPFLHLQITGLRGGLPGSCRKALGYKICLGKPYQGPQEYQTCLAMSDFPFSSEFVLASYWVTVPRPNGQWSDVFWSGPRSASKPKKKKWTIRGFICWYGPTEFQQWVFCCSSVSLTCYKPSKVYYFFWLFGFQILVPAFLIHTMP